MSEVITLNGEIFNEREFLRPLMYGEGVFETFRYRGKLPKYIGKHYRRLMHGANFLKIPVITYDDYIYYIEKTVEKLEDKSDLYVKTVLLSTGNLYYPLHPDGYKLLVIAKPYTPPKTENVKLIVSPFKVHSSDPILKIKSTNFLRNIVAKRYALEKGYFDALFLNEEDHITETTSANIFWVKGNFLFTPSIDCGLLNGVMRQVVIENAKKLGFKVKEGHFTLEDLEDAQAIFITNSLNGIIRVHAIENLGGKR